ncbi:hypothetical protein [Ectopseudomonas oleovorans]|nr:hypothetical protein [Pseudomonas oleovorans]
MKRAIEVLLDGKRVMLLQAPDGGPASVQLANVQENYMRAWAHASSDEEVWRWQLPNIQDGQAISFRVIQAEADDISPPQEVEKRDPEQVAAGKQRAKEWLEAAKKNKPGSESA